MFNVQIPQQDGRILHFTMEEKPYASLQIQAHNLLTRVSLPGHVYLSDR